MPDLAFSQAYPTFPKSMTQSLMIDYLATSPGVGLLTTLNILDSGDLEEFSTMGYLDIKTRLFNQNTSRTFSKEGVATWFTYMLTTGAPTLGYVPTIFLVGSVGGTGSGKDVELSNTAITVATDVKITEFNLNIDIQTLMEKT